MFFLNHTHQARPPGIYKGEYLQELARRYNSGNMDDVVIPQRPDWCLEEEGGGADTDEVGGANRKRKRGREKQNEVRSVTVPEFHSE